MRMQEVQSIVVMCESEMGGLQSCNRWKIVYSAAMQSSSQFFTLKRRAQRLLLRFSASGVLDGDLVISAGMVKSGGSWRNGALLSFKSSFRLYFIVGV